MRGPFLALLLLACCGGVHGLDAGTRDSGRMDARVDGPRDAGSDASSAITASTEVAGGRLALRVNIPARSTDCPSCADVDHDGLVDAWEDAAIELLRPLLRFDEAESLIDDSGAALAEVARVFPADASLIRAIIVLVYNRDYGSECIGISGHAGDSERVALELEALGSGPGDVIVRRMYTAGHEGTAADSSRLFATDELETFMVLESTPPRWVIFPSQDKHASYATVDVCENVSVVPCVDEDCGPDGVADPSLFDRLPPWANAGELDAPRLGDLSALGFPGEDAWADQPFCGGNAGASGCPPSIREKLLTDPFL